jgi:hypothetical protein
VKRAELTATRAVSDTAVSMCAATISRTLLAARTADEVSKADAGA